jgi:hypothetical protein
MNFRKLAAPLRVARATRREETFEMCARDYLTQLLVLSISFERATFFAPPVEGKRHEKIIVWKCRVCCADRG